MLRTGVLLLFMSVMGNIHAQVLDIDRETGQDSSTRKLAIVSDMSFSLDKQQLLLRQVFNQTEVANRFRSDWVLIGIMAVDIELAGDDFWENNGFIQTRFRDDDSRKVAPDLFAQLQWDYVQGMRSRTLFGTNVRTRLTERENMDAYFSGGVFYEVEVWDAGLSQFEFDSAQQIIVSRNLFRLNTVLKMGWEISENVDMVIASYLQFPISDRFLSPRWYLSCVTNLHISNRVNLFYRYEHTLDGYRVLPIDDYFFHSDFGVRLSLS